MKNIKEFYAKLADLMDEYDLKMIYPAAEDAIFIEGNSGTFNELYEMATPESLRKEAGVECVIHGMLRKGFDDHCNREVEAGRMVSGTGTNVTVNGTIDGNLVSNAKGQIKDGKLEISDIDMAFGKAAESVMKGGNDE